MRLKPVRYSFSSCTYKDIHGEIHIIPEGIHSVLILDSVSIYLDSGKVHKISSEDFIQMKSKALAKIYESE